MPPGIDPLFFKVQTPIHGDRPTGIDTIIGSEMNLHAIIAKNDQLWVFD
jgi:hypothetical protein